MPHLHFKLTEIPKDRLFDQRMEPARFVRLPAGRFGVHRLMCGLNLGRGQKPGRAKAVMACDAASAIAAERRLFSSDTATGVYAR